MSRAIEELEEVALTRAEYDRISSLLEREPNDLELGLFGALWSEHCGYKHTKKLLRTLPSSSSRTLVEAGAENAGVLQIGNGRSVVFKIESHNHPSAVEPTQGAATGVGGIVRDILAMGARPIAILNSLRFGNPVNDRQRYLLEGVVDGISTYGNCIGIPNVGGEVMFDDSYADNPLVNAMCLGLVEDDALVRAVANRAGELLMLVGSPTGRDGIHGASGLASRVINDEGKLRSAVQIGDPFMEKVLIEACLEAKLIRGVSGIQDCGAAGISSAAVEMAARSGLGLRIDVQKIPSRSSGMTAYELMLSESQERMLLAIQPAAFGELERLFAKWYLEVATIGEFTENGRFEVWQADRQLCVILLEHLTNPPEYTLAAHKPRALGKLQNTVLDTPEDSDLKAIWLRLLGSPNVASKRHIYRQYDHQVQNGTIVQPECGEAALVRIPHTSQGLAITTDGNARFCFLNPHLGGAIAVAEACRNLSVLGAEPIGLTDCLNFGDPADPLVGYQLEQCVNGIAEAAKLFSIPVVSGNVSLYNQSSKNSILPTPVIGAVGILESVDRFTLNAFRKAGDAIVVLGADTPWDEPAGLAGSEYDQLLNNRLAGNPRLDFELELRLQKVCRQAARERIFHSARDSSVGGMAVALAKCALTGTIGFTVDFPFPSPCVAALFGESQSRVVVSLPEEHLKDLKSLAAVHSLPWARIGTVGGRWLRIGKLKLGLESCSKVWHTALRV